MFVLRLAPWISLALVFFGARGAAQEPAAPSSGMLAWVASEQPAIRGITVGPIESSQWPGRGYGTPYSAALLDELARLGTNWISITPFGRIFDLKSTEIVMDFEAPYLENRDAVRRMVQQAHERGMKVLLIPHLWVDTGGWRGEIDPGTDAGWERYQASYRAFVLAWAELAAEAGADAFSIGVECKSWSGRFGGYWTSLIRDVRATFRGLLTYSANWDEVEGVLFWDKLDLIGINAFYPLAQHDDATYDEYVAGAKRARDGIRRAAELLDMPVLFVEVGYTTRANAAVEPWLWPDDMSDVRFDEHEQARALAAVFEAFLPEPWFSGFFVWRYYANLDDVSQEHIWGFSPHGKLAEQLLERVFAEQWGADPPRGWLR
jgi:sugar phosphate isomerase/epimerase